MSAMQLPGKNDELATPAKSEGNVRWRCT